MITKQPTASTWPERVYMLGEEHHFVQHYAPMGFVHKEYIRADLVAAREQQLIDRNIAQPNFVAKLVAMQNRREQEIIRATIADCRKCYSPDDTSHDWDDKMRALDPATILNNMKVEK